MGIYSMSTIEILEGVAELLELDNEGKLTASGNYLVVDTVLSDNHPNGLDNQKEYPKVDAILSKTDASRILRETIDKLKLIELLE